MAFGGCVRKMCWSDGDYAATFFALGLNHRGFTVNAQLNTPPHVAKLPFGRKPSQQCSLATPRFSSILSRVKTAVDVMPEEIMTLKEVAEYLKLAEKTAYRLTAEGKIPGFKVGGSWRFRRDAIENWIDQQTESRRT